MMRRGFLLMLALMTLVSCSHAISGTDIDGLSYSIDFQSENIIHVSVSPIGGEGKGESHIVDAYTPYPCRVRETAQRITLKTEAVKVIVDKSDGSIRFYNKEDKLLLTDRSREFASGLTQTFESAGDEALYGLGQYQNCHMNYRGKTARLVQSNMDIVNPYLVTTGGYALLWDNCSATDFSDDGRSFTFVSEVADVSDYYIIVGNSMEELVATYRHLTGAAPMFPRWTYGFWQSKERYRSFDELEGVVEEFRNRGIPLDNIVQDWEYWGDKSHWNSMRFDAEGFGGARERIAALHEKGVHFALSVWPGFGPETEIYKEMAAQNALFDEPTWAGYKVFDAYNPEAREIFWNHLEGLQDLGVDAWWLDATEPSFRDGFTQEGQEARSKSAGMTAIGSFDRYLNIYSLEMMKDLYPRLRDKDPQKRVMILTRSAFASQQRYATAIWSGDISASWETFHKQLIAGLNISVSGIPYWTTDIGGFYISGRDGMFPDTISDDEYKELYSRWFQFGAFCPLFRAHGTDAPREPWRFGDEGDIWYDNQVKYIRMRYTLLPYIYSVAHKVTADGYTFMRPLAMDFSSDPEACGVDYAYMFGPSFYVRPVFESSARQPEVSTYLPKCEGGVWYEYESAEPLAAGSVHTVPSTCDKLPLYVRAGSIIPTGKMKQWADEFKDTELNVAVYAGADGEFVWYDDEGDSYRYEEGLCSEVCLSWDDDTRVLTLGKRKGSYPGMPQKVNMNITLHLQSGESVHGTIEYEGKEIKIQL